MQRLTVKLTLDNKEVNAFVEIESFDSKRRLWRAFQSGSLYFGIAILSVLIPVAHFFLVPAFLLAAIISFRKKLKTSEIVLQTKLPCPNCSHEMAIGDTATAWPMSVDCTKCFNRITVKPL